MERAVLDRVQAVADPRETRDPEYVDGMRTAVGEALEYALAAVEHGDTLSRALPAQLLFQARLAARNGVGLDIVLRRYFAGYTLLADVVVEEAAAAALDATELRVLLQTLAVRFERLMELVSVEFHQEFERRPRSTAARRAQLVGSLLEGDLVDPREIDLDFGAEHLGAIAVGAGAEEALRRLARRLDRRLLAVPRHEDTVWAWLSAAAALDAEWLAGALDEVWPPGVSLALGEPAAGLEGWRLTHHQARAAIAIAVQAAEPCVRYADVALVASVRRDDLLATSLRRLYLEPLEAGRDGGESARETLRAYFAAGRNVSSAAAALRVNRHTVASRLRAIEEALGRNLDSCVADLELALELADHTQVPSIRR